MDEIKERLIEILKEQLERADMAAASSKDYNNNTTAHNDR